MKKKLIIVSIVTVALLAVGIYYYFKPVSGLVKTKADFTIDAPALYSAFHDNEEKANSMYLDQVIEVSGTIVSVDNQKIELEANSRFGIICEMEPNTNNQHLKIGDQIVCRGLCTGKLMDVVLTRCLVIN